jgi:streptomycin 3"-adenylyltransferase
VTAALACDVPLFGPSAADVLDPVPVADVVRACVAEVPEVLEDLDSDTTNVLLTLARAWYTATTAQIVPKDIAADWAIDRLPPQDRGVMAHAKAANFGTQEEDWEPVQAMLPAVAAHLTEHIASA